MIEINGLKFSKIIEVLKATVHEDISKETLVYFDSDMIVGISFGYGVVWFHDFAIDHPFTLPMDLLRRIGSVEFSEDDCLKLELTDDLIVVSFKRLVIKVPRSEVNAEFYTGILNQMDIDSKALSVSGLLDVFKKCEVGITDDWRRSGVHGLIFDGDFAYGTDNYRIVRCSAKEFEIQLEGLLPMGVLDIVGNLKYVPTKMIKGENLRYFDFGEFIFFYSLTEVTPPKLAEVFSRLGEKEVKAEICVKGKKSSIAKIGKSFLVSEDEESKIIDVSISKTGIVVTATEKHSGISYKFELEATSTEELEFGVNGDFFFDGLRTFSKFCVFDDSLLFFNEDRLSDDHTYLVMLVH